VDAVVTLFRRTFGVTEAEERDRLQAELTQLRCSVEAVLERASAAMAESRALDAKRHEKGLVERHSYRGDVGVEVADYLERRGW
jgi:hypothetical protein